MIKEDVFSKNLLSSPFNCTLKGNKSFISVYLNSFHLDTVKLPNDIEFGPVFLEEKIRF